MATLMLSCSESDDGMLIPLLGTAASVTNAGGPSTSPASAGQDAPQATPETTPAVDSGNAGGGGDVGDDPANPGTNTGDSDGGADEPAEDNSDIDSDDDDVVNEPSDDAPGDDSTDDGSSGDSDDSSGSDGDGDDTGDTAGGDSDDDGTVSDTGPTKACSKRTIELDTSKGKWFATNPAALTDLSKAEKQALKKEIRALRTQRKAALKAKDKATAKALLAKIKSLREKLGHGAKQSGIHTYWANQTLLVHVRGNCQAGWYKLRVTAKNIQGPLPDFYKRFSVSVTNDANDRAWGALSIKASDKRYHRSGLLVKLEEGDSTIRLVWTNDAYQQGVYDANIQIKKVALRYARKVKLRKKMARKATDYCYTNGTWFWDKNTARTYWKDQTIGFCFDRLAPGKYEVEVVAKNYGKVPAGYKNFEVMAAGDGVADQLSIKADEKKFHKGKTVLDLRGGNVLVALTWLNDRYVPEKGEDANIQIRKVKLKRIGNSDRSALAAYLRSMAGGNRRVTIAILAIAILGLGVTVLLSRKRRLG